MGIFTASLLADLVAIVVTAIALIYAYFLWAYQYWKSKGVPYLEPSVPFGNIPNPITSDMSVGESFLLLYKQAKAKGWKHCGVYTVALPTWLVLDLDLLKHVFTKDFHHFVDRGVYVNERDDPISATLFALGGTKWKNLRAKLSPTFTSGKMKMMFQIMVDCGVILEKYIEEDVSDKDVVDIKDVLGRFTTDVIGSCAFGLDCNSFEEPNSPFRVYGKKVFEDSTLDLIKTFFAFSFPNLARSLGVRQFKRDVSDFYTKVVEDTISYREKNGVSRNDFLQLLMEIKNNTSAGDGNTLTMNEIVAQSFVFFVAGFETSSTTMTFALFELAIHPEIQDKVREEIKTVLARHDDKVTYDSMNELVYMKQVIDETLRKYPPIPILTRECVQEYKVPGEDVVIEKGTMVLIPVLGLHYDEEYYENPEAFDPERFSPENKKERHPYSQLAFGEGPRVCIGERFGILQTKVGLTCFLRNHTISLNNRTKLPLKMDAKSPVTTAVGGIWLDVKKL